ncbi:YraN family protein [Candidatus Marinamargulisbacteria bacterium SCGC AG-439-L15]|nr:YraN family protein [Candidatus Marinamargulisbacteria bacterium SCGC AG-439-L15]
MRKKGDKGESLAVRYLQKRGYRILKRNFHVRYGEIDIVASKKDVLVFVEVKAYDKPYLIHPKEVITTRKLKRMRFAAHCYLLGLQTEDIDCRFDLVIIEKGVVVDHFSI